MFHLDQIYHSFFIYGKIVEDVFSKSKNGFVCPNIVVTLLLVSADTGTSGAYVISGTLVLLTVVSLMSNFWIKQSISSHTLKVKFTTLDVFNLTCVFVTNPC